MFNKDAKLSEIRKLRDKQTFLSTTGCIAAVVGIIASPAIIVTAGFLAAGALVGLVAIAKNEKLNAEESLLLLNEEAYLLKYDKKNKNIKK